MAVISELKTEWDDAGFMVFFSDMHRSRNTQLNDRGPNLLEIISRPTYFYYGLLHNRLGSHHAHSFLQSILPQYTPTKDLRSIITLHHKL